MLRTAYHACACLARRGNGYRQVCRRALLGINVGTPKRTVPIDETIVVVADNGRVSSIAIRIDLSGLY